MEALAGLVLVVLKWIWDTIVIIFNSLAFTNFLLVIVAILLFFLVGVVASR
jgi:hypothetical protein